MAKHISLGKKGEDIAVNYLVHKGYQILDRNVQLDKVELDIVAKKDDTYVFVEVKTRSTDQYGYPEQAITGTKRQHILDAVEMYLELHHIDAEIRIDVLTVILRENLYSVMHFEDAVEPYE